MSLLSMHSRYFNGVPLLPTRKPFRSKERCFILLIFGAFILIFCGTFFYLPELRSGAGTRERVYKAYKKIQEAGPDLLIPAPPYADEHRDSARPYPKHFPYQHDEDPHLVEDRVRLKAKIDEELDFPKSLVKRVIGIENKVSSQSLHFDENKSNVMDIYVAGVKTVPPKGYPHPLVTGGEDPDEDIRQKRLKIVEMMKHAWGNYVKYAWGLNELKPISKKAHNGSLFGSAPLGATIVDGLDTLYIMGLHDEFKRGRDWIAKNLDLDQVNMDLSVFETNIRFVGGLLSCFALTGDTMFRDKAEMIAKKLLPAFQTPTGIPYALVNPKTGSAKNYAWASASSSILSEFGTLHLEFAYLSDVTGDPVYKDKMMQIRKVLKEAEKPNGLYPNFLNPKTGRWGQQHMSMGGLGDSFYEYLLKAWIQSGRTDTEIKEMYEDAMSAVFKHMLQVSPGGLTYISDIKYDKLEYKMDELACFSAGMLGLGSKLLNNELSKKHMTVAEGIANTCHEAFNRSATKLAPETFGFIDVLGAKSSRSPDKYYILRPETMESFFIMWRVTGDPKYRKWGWEQVEALEKHCRTDGGYSGIRNVYLPIPQKDDVQQSFFLAEMLKYLYLIFSNNELISLDEWVFNSEAHPLPIKGHNAFYREAESAS